MTISRDNFCRILGCSAIINWTENLNVPCYLELDFEKRSALDRDFRGEKKHKLSISQKIHTCAFLICHYGKYFTVLVFMFYFLRKWERQLMLLLGYKYEYEEDGQLFIYSSDEA